MQQEVVSVTTPDRLLLHGLLCTPGDAPRGVVVHVHRMAGSFYDDIVREFAAAYTANGFALLSVGTRGHNILAHFPTDEPEEDYRRIGNAREVFSECVRDIAAWLDFLTGRGYHEVALQGHSLGSAKVTYYAATAADARVVRLILLSPPDLVYRAEALPDHRELVRRAQRMVEAGEGDALLPDRLWDWYHLSAKTYLDLTTRDNPADVFNIYAPDRPSATLGRIALPLLATYGGHDSAIGVAPETALSILRRKATACPQFDSLVIPGAPHTYYGHQAELAERVSGWLGAVAMASWRPA